ncbi:MAG: helix-turn-helix transcriptional regulator [Roseburia sp.]|nr:helix-turn-helix transcriptional regulator [Roseburia sp.]
MDDIIEKFRVSLNKILAIREIDTVSFGKALGVDPSVVRRWRNKGIDVRLKTLIKLADHFQCSIEYLCGKSSDIDDFEPKSSYPHFGERLLMVMNEHKVKPFRLFRDTAVIPSKYYYWISGGEPSLTSLEIIAEYLNVTLDYLVGRQKIK